MSKVSGADAIGPAVSGQCQVGDGVYGQSNFDNGVHGDSRNGNGVFGHSQVGDGVFGYSEAGSGVSGHTINDQPAIFGWSEAGPGVGGNSVHNSGVQGYSFEGPGVAAFSEHGTALYAASNSDASTVHVTSEPGQPAIFAEVPHQSWGFYTIASGDGVGVYANSQNGIALHGSGDFGTGVVAESGGGVALQVIGRIQVRGTEDPLTQIVGVATLRKGDTSVVVTAPAVTAESLVLLTPHANPGGQLWVDVKTGIFAIQTSAAPTQDVPIAYLIIN